MEPDSRAILEAAIQAPSGENVQPWRFHISGDSIELHHVDVDSEIYDTGNRGSYVSHGAALENMSVAAQALGYSPEITLFPDSTLKTHIATMKLGSKGNPAPEAASLAKAIPARMTNRNIYETRALETSSVDALLTAAATEPTVRYQRITDRATIQKLARVGSINEEVMLQNKTLHQFFFSHVSWTKEEDAQKRVGFYIKTLGLPPPVQGLFKLFRQWPIMSFLKVIGFPKLIGKGNAETYAASAEIGMLIIEKDAPEEFVLAGRALERIWLAATSQNVSLQPLAGTLFMNYYAATDASQHVFSTHERSLIEQGKRMAYEVAGTGTIAFMFRLGYGAPPEAHATRFPLERFLI